MMKRQARSWASKPGVVAAMTLAGLLTAVTSSRAQAALPIPGDTRQGRVEIRSDGTTMTITQSTPSAKLDWKSFDIAKDHAVTITQPNAQAFIVNRVTGPTVSRIDGSLTANGRIYLVNPNGVVFGPTATVDVGGLVAAGMSMLEKDMDRSGESMTLRGAEEAAAHNRGTIRIAHGGVAALAGARVDQHGSLEAPGGVITLTDRGALSVNARGEVVVLPDPPPDHRPFGVTVAGRILAPGGTVRVWGDARAPVRMTADAAIRAEGGRVELASLHDSPDAPSLVLSIVHAGMLSLSAPLRATFTPRDKVYDGTVAARVDASELSGIELLPGSNLRMRVSHGFDSAAAGERRVGASAVVTGFNADADAQAPLTVTSPTLGARIEPRLVEVELLPHRRAFDGTREAPVEVGLATALPGDAVGVVHRSATFDSAEPGERRITVSGLRLVGEDAANYRLRAEELTLTGFIDPAPQPLPMPEGGRPVPEVPTPRPIDPAVKPDPVRPSPVPSASRRPPVAAKRSMACEARRDVVRRRDCDDAWRPPPVPAAAGPRDGGLRQAPHAVPPAR